MTLPASYQELERIYQGLQLKQSSCIAVSSAETKEGVSLLVDALARRSASVHKSVLVVDLNLLHPRAVAVSSTPSHWQNGVPPAPIESDIDGVYLMPAPLEKISLLKLREPGELEALVAQWKQEYSLVLLDCSAVNLNNQANIPASRALEAADGVIISYLAGYTAAVKLKQACDDIQRRGVLVLGVVINDRYNPALKQELLRSLPKMFRWTPWFSRWLCSKIANSQLLSIKI